MAKGIICPKCGAENDFIGNCAYCGTPLEPIEKGANGELHSKGVHRKLLNDSFLKQYKDEFGSKVVTSPIYGSCHVGGAMTSHLYIGLYHEVQDNDEHLYLYARSHYFGLPNKAKKLYISFGDSSLELNPKEHRNNLAFSDVSFGDKEWALYEISEDVLLKICESSHLAFKLMLDVKKIDEARGIERTVEEYDTESDDKDKFKDYARSFYNGLYDSSRYASSIEKASKDNSGCLNVVGKMGVFILVISILAFLI